MRKLTRTEANFENLLEAALLVEGHCSHASRGCSCRGCDECEENYMMESEEGEKESLADLIGKYVEGKPNTDVPYGDDPRADDEEYDNPDEEQEAFQIGDIGDVIKTAVELPTEKELKAKRGGIAFGLGGDPVVDKVIKIRREVGNKLDAITARLRGGGGVY